MVALMTLAEKPEALEDWTAADEVFNRELGRRIAVARTGRGMSQDDLALATGLAVQTIRQAETGEHRIGLNMLQILSDGLGEISAAVLLPKPSDMEASPDR
jgi:transcriptional regulator with XRE-family HTH domain